MRFRRLTEEEFAALEPEFVKFLSSQGIDAVEWQKAKSEKPHKVEYLLDEFSTFFGNQRLRELHTWKKSRMKIGGFLNSTKQQHAFYVGFRARMA